MFLRYVTAAGVEEGEPAHLAEWRGRGDGYLWLDLKECDDEAAALLSDEFGFHPQSIQACRQRSVCGLRSSPHHDCHRGQHLLRGVDGLDVGRQGRSSARQESARRSAIRSKNFDHPEPAPSYCSGVMRPRCSKSISVRPSPRSVRTTTTSSHSSSPG